jgi:hypothetical protein
MSESNPSMKARRRMGQSGARRKRPPDSPTRLRPSRRSVRSVASEEARQPTRQNTSSIAASTIEQSAAITAERRSASGTTVAADIALWRMKYPDGLVCTACGVLLACRRESYGRLVAGVAAADGYVCAECRRDAVEADRVHAVKIEQARRAGRASAAVRKRRVATATTARYETLPVPSLEPGVHSLVFPFIHASSRGGFRNTGGRPRKYMTNAARQRAYRARRRVAKVSK